MDDNVPKPFSLVRMGPKGRDSHLHTFGVRAQGNAELVRMGHSEEAAVINGASSSDAGEARKRVQRLVDELNAVFAKYWRWEL